MLNFGGFPKKENANRKKLPKNCPILTFQQQITWTKKNGSAPPFKPWRFMSRGGLSLIVFPWFLGGVKTKKNGVEGTPTSSTVVCLLVFHVFFVLFLDTVFSNLQELVGVLTPETWIGFLKVTFLRIGIPWDASPSMPTIWENFCLVFPSIQQANPRKIVGFGGIFVGEDPELHWRVGKNHHKRILSQAGQPLNCWGITNLVPGTLKEHNEPFINGCFNWKMEPNLYIGNGWKSPNIHFKLGCLGFCGKPHIGKARKRI